MDRSTWRVLMEVSLEAVRALPKARRRAVYGDLLILRMWLWAVMHDRPFSWACSRQSYDSMFRPRRLPSVSRFSRRLRTMRMARARVALHRALIARGQSGLVSYLDGKAMAIGEYSTDPDARDGVVTTGRFRKGYKLHARANQAGFFERYRVGPLNQGEALIARKLVEGVPPGGLVLADTNYDSRTLYGLIESRGALLFTPMKGPPSVTDRPRAMPDSRRTVLAIWRSDLNLARQLMLARRAIERLFARLTGFGGGLCPLPAWVRRLSRVRLWLDAKIAVYHARLIALQRLKNAP